MKIFETMHRVDTFVNNCKRIEANPNYQSSITDRELLALVVRDGVALHTPRRSALAIQRMDINPKDARDVSLGVFYQIKIAKKGPLSVQDEDFVWHVDSSLVIFVKKTGEMAVLSTADVMKRVYTLPLAIDPEQFLEACSLHHLSEESAQSCTPSA